jgi:hypothetical protein
MVANLELLESGWSLGDRDRVATFDKPAEKIMLQVTQIVSFLLERAVFVFEILGFQLRLSDMI